MNGKLRTECIAGDFYPKATDSRTPYRHNVAGLLDLNGDGRLEIILLSSYYEGGATSVWQFGQGKVERRIETGCGA